MRDAFDNIIAGARLALFLPVTEHAFRFSRGQVWMMATAGLLLSIGLDWTFTAAPSAFNGYGFHDEALFLVLVMLAAWVVAVAAHDARLNQALPVMWLSAGLAAYPVQALIISGWPDPGLDFSVAYGLGIAWWTLIVYRSLDTLGIGRVLRRINQTVLVALIVTLPDWHFTPTSFWYPLPTEVSESDPPPRLDAEAVLFAQQSRLDAALAQLPAETPGRADLYAVGFGSHGSQDVFMREIAVLEGMNKSRFGQSARTLKLINNIATVEQAPLATLSNLQYALTKISGLMDVDEDILFLFLTSHGSSEHLLSVELANLPLQPLATSDLTEMINTLPVRWKVIVISACYSGGFLPSLANEHTLVITAAHAERQSFGCSNDATMTWFGRAFMQEGLAKGLGFVDAYANARELVSGWESENEHTESLPQIAAGPEIVKKLAELGW